MRCADFYEKWRRNPNWCEKAPDTVRQIDHYLELVEELENLGVDSACIYKRFPEGVARDVLKIADEKTRAAVMGNASGMLIRGERVGREDIKVWIGLEEGTLDLTPKSGEDKPTIVGFGKQGKPGLEKEAQTENPPKSLAEQMKQVNPGAQVTINPIVINDTYRESPFKTAAEVLAHDKDPLGVNQMFTKTDTTTAREPPATAQKTDKELYLEACEQAYEFGKPDFRQAIDELIQYHPSWKNPAGVIYFCVTDPAEAAHGRKHK